MVRGDIVRRVRFTKAAQIWRDATGVLAERLELANIQTHWAYPGRSVGPWGR
jgi:hypothetical protein